MITQQKIYEFGKKALEQLKENISDDMFERDIEYADIAVEHELIEYVAYDPEIHIDVDIDGIEKGDMIYYWGEY